MNHHPGMESTLQRYHDGSLDDRRQQWLEQHLQECASCSRELQRLEETDALLACVRPAAPELTSLERDQLLRIALAASSANRRRAGWFLRWRLATAALFLAGSISGITWQHQSTGDHGSVSAASPAPKSLKLLATNNAGISEPVRKVPLVLQAAPKRRRHGRPHSRRQWAHPPKPQPVLEQPVETLAAWSAGTQKTDFVPEELAPAEPQLLVLATHTAPALTVNVSVSSSDQPGYAKAVSIMVTPSGTHVETQATVSSCIPGDPVEQADTDEATALGEVPDLPLMNQPERENSHGMD